MEAVPACDAPIVQRVSSLPLNVEALSGIRIQLRVNLADVGCIRIRMVLNYVNLVLLVENTRLYCQNVAKPPIQSVENVGKDFIATIMPTLLAYRVQTVVWMKKMW